MQDKIEKWGKSVIQHGKSNNRIYLMKLSPENVSDIVPFLDQLAQKNGYSKIFAKIQAEVLPCFIPNGYVIEAFVPGFYNNQTDCLFVSKFSDDKRKITNQEELITFSRLLHSSESSQKIKYSHSLRYSLQRLETADAESISDIFRQVFKSYPFPVFDPEYIKETMKGDRTQYFGVKEGTRLIGISTAETDLENRNAEMTDFAVLPEFRGQNLAFRLLVKMEHAMKCANIKTVYTIARLKEPGMNKTFLKSGYKYTGTLANNTNIGGSIESMNIFYKHL
ncbi:MAG: putative beta-lysine N-acetyltransferase [Bacteroidia bacterium]|nr:putative beta-lysine N-acetyltransferase [Bacteroidia bacterium]